MGGDERESFELALAEHGLLAVDATETFCTAVHTALPAVSGKEYMPPSGTLEIRDIAKLRALLSVPDHSSTKHTIQYPPPKPPQGLLELYELARRGSPESMGCALDDDLARPEHKQLKRALFNATQAWVAGDAERVRAYADLINTVSFPRTMKVRILAVEELIVAAGHPLELPAAPDEFFMVICAALEVETGGVIDVTHALELKSFRTLAHGDLVIRRVGVPGEHGGPGVDGADGLPGQTGHDALVSGGVCLRPATWGSGGADGGPGGDGIDGGNGTDVPCGAISFGALRGAPSIVAEIGGGRGGDGGAGGRGGRGGASGPPGARCEACDCGAEAAPAGLGGVGGSGGAAGNGGDFGLLSIRYRPEDGVPRPHITRDAGGTPGRAGAPGEGGAGARSGRAGKQGCPGFSAGVSWCVD